VAPHPPAISTTGAIVITIGALYFGREIFIPLALAILLGFIMTPPMLWLRRRGVPRILAVFFVVLVAFSAIGGVAIAVGAQLVQLAENLPSYQRNIKEKLSSLRSAGPGSGLVERVTDTLKDLGNELSRPEETAPQPAPSAGQPRREPVPVVIEPAPMRPLEVMQTVLGPLLGPLGTAALVVLFVIFILIEREELRDRFIKLVSGGDIQRSTEAITEAAGRVSRYLMMQLVVNATYGIPIGVGLYLIGVPNAVLWGVLAAVLRFIPYLGPWLAALFPLTIAFGVDPGWSMLLWTIALFLVVELISNNAVEPWLYGSSTGLASFAVILAAIFWTLLWGPVGLFLATPLTVCLVVIGRYVPRLEFLGVLLGSSPVLTPAERLYQRLLSGNVEEAIEIAESHVDQSSSLSFYDDVAIPALRLAENDRRRSADVEFRRSIADGMVAVVREVEDHVREPGAASSPPQPVANDQVRPRVLCIGGRAELDLAAAEIVVGRLSELGVAAKAVAPISVSQDAIGQLDLEGVDVVCISYFHASPEVYARYVCRRLGRRAPHLVNIVCCWNCATAEEGASALEAQLGGNASVVTSLAAAEQKIIAALSQQSEAHPDIPGVSARESAYLERLRDMGLAAGNGPEFERLAARVAEQLGTSIVLVALLEEASPAGAPVCKVEEGPTQPLALSQLICAEVVSTCATVVVEDVAEDPRFAPNAELLEKGIRFFAAAPLRSPSGFLLGALCVLDSKKRELTADERRQLEAIASDVVQTAILTA
jgi:predicted PurR-regulated permease PerM/GAF domain-containing protein